MSTLDQITKEKQRIGEALARVDAQRDKLTSQLSELEATERVLARYTKGTRAERRPQRRRRRQQRKQPLQPGHAAAGVLLPENRRAAGAARRPWGIRSSPWQPARRSRKSPPHAREFARTMSASSSLGTSGPAASKSEMGGSTPHRQRGRRNLARSDTGR